MTSMYMSPSTAAVAPTMTTMAPVMEFVAAPYSVAASAAEPVVAAPITLAAPPVAAPPMAVPMATVSAPATSMVVTGTPSYVAPPVVRTVEPMAQPGPPANLTAGLPDPASIEQQKAQYAKSLDQQLAQAVQSIEEQAKNEKQQIQTRMQTQLAQYQLQVEEQTKMQMMQVDAKVQAQLKGLREAAVTQKSALEEQAAVATMEYRKKKAMEEQGLKSYQIQKTFYDAEMKLMQQYKEVSQKGAPGPAPGTAL